MYVTNITNDYDDNLPLNNNCTDNENNDIFIPALLFTILSGLSILCLISLMVYTIVKPLINNKCLRNFFIPNILWDVLFKVQAIRVKVFF